MKRYENFLINLAYANLFSGIFTLLLTGDKGYTRLEKAPMSWFYVYERK